MVKMVKVSSIKADGHYRAKVGDLSSLCSSIEAHGLLQPIGLDGKSNLLFGLRRLSAFRKLGRDKIPAIRFDLDDLASLEIQREENAERADIDEDDKLELAKAIKAKLKERRGNPNLPKSSHKDGKPASFSNSGQVGRNWEEPAKGEETREHVAKAAGFKSTTDMRRHEAVQAKAPEAIWQAVKDGVVKVSDAEKVLDKPAEEQLAALVAVKAGEAKSLVGAMRPKKTTTAARSSIRLARAGVVANEDSEPVKDVFGRVIPANLAQVQADGKALADACRTLAELQSLVASMKLDPIRGAHQRLGVETDVINLKHKLEASIFHCVCVYCEAKEPECKVCKGAGWINKSSCERAPVERRVAV